MFNTQFKTRTVNHKTQHTKGIFKQEIIKFWQNNVSNTQFITKTGDLNLDLMAKAFLERNC